MAILSEFRQKIRKIFYLRRDVTPKILNKWTTIFLRFHIMRQGKSSCRKFEEKNSCRSYNVDFITQAIIIFSLKLIH